MKRWGGRETGTEAAHLVNPMRPHTISAGRRRQARRVVAESQAKARAKAGAMGRRGQTNGRGRPALSRAPGDENEICPVYLFVAPAVATMRPLNGQREGR